MEPQVDWDKATAWYTPPDPSWPAALVLNGEHDREIDGESHELSDSPTAEKLGIVLIDCSNITLKNCVVHGHYYGVYAIDCENIVLEDCDLERNFSRQHTAGLIQRREGDRLGWGGGIYFRNVHNSAIYRSCAGNQFNGIDLVECSDILVEQNKIPLTQNYGIHLWKSERCSLIKNDCRWAIRFSPLCARDTADSAGILIEESSHDNIVSSNDLRCGGDGLFVRDLTMGENPSNRTLITENDCSHSPNNAIEAVFSEGTVLRDNKTSHSRYGMWLDYSTGLVVCENRIEGNENEGLHVKRGSFREFNGNIVHKNGVGVVLQDTDGKLVRESINGFLFQDNGEDLREEKADK